jgi:CheY-like chemotaxis protein
MGGKIGATSRVGQGSTFWFIIDLPMESGAAPPSPPASAFEGLRVAVVDEDEVNRRVLDEQLQHLGIRSESFGSSVEALKAVREARSAGDPYGIVIMSDHLPTVGGRTLAGSFRRNPALQDVVLLLMQPVSQRGKSRRPSQLEFSDFLTRPVRFSQFADTLMAVWSARRGEAAAPSMLETARAAAGEKSESGMAAGRPWVLLVEDNAINQKVAVRMLNRLGCDVEVAENGREALDRFARGRFDLVFMDCQMPEMDGYEATVEIRRRESSGGRIPIIAMTAHAMQGDRERCLRAGMSDYISKPVDMEDLRTMIECWLSKREVPAGSPESQVSEGT